jgi:N-acetylneuraminic acid mutarotase
LLSRIEILRRFNMAKRLFAFQALAIVLLLFQYLSIPAAAQPATSGPYWPGAAVSGSWYDPARSGEGIVLQFLPDGRALATWFTYPAANDNTPGNEQAWLITDGSVVEGSTIKFARVLQPQGGIFGDAFDPSRITATLWGTMELEFRDCNTMTLRYTGPAAFGSGQRTMTRLTALDQLDCRGGRTLTPSGARALAGMRAKNGAWFVTTRSGEGWMIEELADNRAVVYWFTYDPQGRQAWTIGIGTRNGNRIDITDNNITRGARFGSAFNPAAIQSIRWGTLSFVFSDCNTVDATYSSVLPGYGSTTRRAARLTEMAGAACIDGTPQPRINGGWTELARMPAPAQSEHAVTTLNDQLYALGGFGDTRGFKRYEPATNSWTVLPQLPGGRDHLAAFAINGGVYFSGGAVNGDGDQVNSGHRYDIANNRWEARPEINAFNFGSHAATLNGRAYIGNGDGSLQEYDPAQRQIRRITPATLVRPRDHSQVVAFLGEIWMIGGRSPETRTVAIYNPVTEEWRAGPAIQRGRGGFAAAVVGDQIIIGGGEILTAPFRTEPSVEIYTAGGEGWNLGPNLPVSVHGTAAGSIGGRFYLVSGSTIAGSDAGQTGRLFSFTPSP